ncbi:MAG TPA: SMP-30/gluconolactonase/LRE family protein [Steroidobacteraceae bacterium]|jgi:sugar lactone lactonase YvrE|nr:SMP-30/gluconolactonase/LRE family protein [Steroidobacteraceae bacterium]
MPTTSAELIDVISVANTLGEGISWDPVRQRVWWTDIQERRLYRYEPVAQTLETFDVPERLGSFGLVEGSGALVAAFESGFALYDPDSARLDWIERPPHDAANVRFNDGRVDRHGRFWAGSMVEGRGEPVGKLYSLRGGRAHVHLTGIAISNSICFSPDGRHLYFADTPRRTILRYDIDPGTGELSGSRTFAETPQDAFPDGSHVDAQGHVWNAHWGAGRIVRYAPDGSISGGISVPATQPTCVAFGGRDLDLIFVTSAREGLRAASLARQPHAGDVFVYRVDVRGLPDSRVSLESLTLPR